MKAFAIKKPVIFGALALAAVVVASGAAVAGRDHSARFVEHFADELSLNDAQRGRLQTSLREAADKRRQLREQTRDEVRALLSRESLDKKDALRLLRLREEKRGQMQDFVAEKIAAFHSELNSEQREKFAAVAPRLLRLYAGKRGKHRRGHWRDDDDDDDRDDEHHRGWF